MGFGSNNSTHSRVVFGSNNSILGQSAHPKAIEAELISKATNTAIVAARSILMSGGSEKIALKTARAAAESVLIPSETDSDSVAGRSSTLSGAFGGKRRKAKRQAEVVASMALMSATTGHSGAGTGMSVGEQFITFRHDEPSVLSGSTAARPPPRTQTPSKSSLSSHVSNNNSNNNHQGPFSPKITVVDNSSKSDELFSPKKNQNFLQQHHQQNYEETQQQNQRRRLQKDKPPTTPRSKNNNDDLQNENRMLQVTTSDSFSRNSTMDSDQQISSGDDCSLMEDPTLSYPTDVDSIIGGNDTRDSYYNEMEAKSATTTTITSWNNFVVGTLLSPLTATMNMFHCGNIVPGNVKCVDDLEHYMKKEKAKEKKSTKRYKTSSSSDLNNIDVLDDELPRKIYKDPDFGVLNSSYSCGSDNLNSYYSASDVSEGNIQVRSSIRETMENLVSRSKRSIRNNERMDENIWSSYESQKKDDGSCNVIKCSRKMKVLSPRNRFNPRKSNSRSTSNNDICSPSYSVVSSSKKSRGTFFKKYRNRGRR